MCMCRGQWRENSFALCFIILRQGLSPNLSWAESPGVCSSRPWRLVCATIQSLVGVFSPGLWRQVCATIQSHVHITDTLGKGTLSPVSKLTFNTKIVQLKTEKKRFFHAFLISFSSSPNPASGIRARHSG